MRDSRVRRVTFRASCPVLYAARPSGPSEKSKREQRLGSLRTLPAFRYICRRWFESLELPKVSYLVCLVRCSAWHTSRCTSPRLFRVSTGQDRSVETGGRTGTPCARAGEWPIEPRTRRQEPRASRSTRRPRLLRAMLAKSRKPEPLSSATAIGCRSSRRRRTQLERLRPERHIRTG